MRGESPMLNILDLAVAFPDRTEKLASLSAELALSRNQMRMYDRFFGFDAFHCDHDEPLDALLSRVIDAIRKRNPGYFDALDHVAYCHTLPSTTVLNGRTGAILAPFAERGAEVFSATMNHCATGVGMLGVFDQLLGDGEVGLILIGEKAFHPAMRVIENTTIMGEAAAAVLVGREPGPYSMVGSFTRHATSFWKNTGLRGENYLEGFEAAYLELASGTLRDAMTRFGRDLDALRWIMPHNVNAPSWYQIAERVGLDPHKLQLATIGCYGHCFGADPFINLCHGAHTGALRPDDEIMLFSVGLGASASCALLQVSAPITRPIQSEQEISQ